MLKDDKKPFVLVKNSKGDKFFCPFDDVQNASPDRVDENEDCIEEDVVGRYAGNIKTK